MQLETLELSPSRILTAWLVFLHAAVLLAVWMADIPAWLQILAAATVVVNLGFSLLQDRRRAGERLIPLSSTRWQRVTQAGTESLFLNRAHVFRYLVILDFKRSGGGRNYRLPVLSDAVTPRAHRRLRKAMLMLEETS